MLSTAQMTPLKATLDTAYVAHGGTAGAIPWSQIIAIIMQIFGGCIPTPTPAKLKEAVADDDQRDAAVRVAMLETLGWGAWRRHNGPGVSLAFKDVVPTTADDTLAAAID